VYTARLLFLLSDDSEHAPPSLHSRSPRLRRGSIVPATSSDGTPPSTNTSASAGRATRAACSTKRPSGACSLGTAWPHQGPDARGRTHGVRRDAVQEFQRWMQFRPCYLSKCVICLCAQRPSIRSKVATILQVCRERLELDSKIRSLFLHG
jgi:hypothetical protein